MVALEGKVRWSPKSVGFIAWEPRVSLAASIANMFSCPSYRSNSTHSPHHYGPHTVLPFTGTFALFPPWTLWHLTLFSSFSLPPVVYNLCLSLPPLDVLKQLLISAGYTWNNFRRSRLISSSSDVIFTESAWSDGSLLCPSWQYPSDVVYPPDTVCIRIYTSE